MKQRNGPPELLTKYFAWFCADEYYEELQGDLEESYYKNIKIYGTKKACNLYRKEVILMLRPSVIRKVKNHTINSNNIDMISNYFKIAIRTMLTQKMYSFINILGLAIGMAATILISIYIHHELSYDRYHEKSDRIYRLSREWLNENGESNLHLGHVAPPFGPLIANDFEGEVEQVVRLLTGGGPLMQNGDKKFEEERLFFAEGNVFEIFSWKLLKGDRKTALTEPNTIVLSESSARKYFEEEDPLGKMITYNNFGMSQEMKITGIIEDTPQNSHFRYDMLASFVTVENFMGREVMMRRWGSNNYSTFLLFPEGYNVTNFETQLPGFIDKHLGENSNGQPASTTNKLHLMPLADIHLHSHLDSEIEANGDIKYIYAYIIIALFILVIACINFMNLSTARSMKRAKEVGVRKVMGANRSSLIWQFVAESILVALISSLLAIGLVIMVLPWFNNFADKELVLQTMDLSFLAMLVLAVTLIVGLIAGSYPAFFLSAFQPAKVLKGSKLTGAGKKVNLRSALVVFQFFISICLIIGVGIIGDQIDYMKTKALGFDKENMVVLPSNDEIYNNFQVVKDRLAKQPGIAEVTLTSRVPSGRLLDSQGGTAEVDGEMKQIGFRIADVHVDHNYLNTLSVQFLAGRNFDPELSSDSSEAFILNKAAVDGLGWRTPEEAIGKKFNYGGRKGYVIGVTDNFHFESLHQNIAPIVFVVTQGRGNNIIVKVKEGYEQQTLSYLEEEWTHLRPGYLFDYYTIGERFNEQYQAEEKLGELITYFSGLAIFIAMLGLYGLSSFTIEQSTKEIGIRKVLGASVNSVMYMFTKRFAILVIIGIALAAPVSYYGMQEWLEAFPYKTTMQPLTFIIGGLLALVFAIMTVGAEIMKAAVSNPVDTLRSE